MPVPIEDLPLPVLLAQAGHRAALLLGRQFSDSGLRPRHGQILMRLEQTGSATQQELLEQLAVDPSVLVGLLNDLEDAALVERVRDPADRRRHIVRLADEGRAVAADVHRSVATVHEQLFPDTSERDLATLRRLLVAVCAAGEDDCR
ncbi:MarR family winged helix-turn-helix transcriptional regulator [Geodermatophilus sp. SYSU D00710]